MQKASASLEMSLREHLLAAGASGSGPAPYPQSSAPPSDSKYPPTGSASPHDPYQPSPSALPPYAMNEDDAGDDIGDEGDSPNAQKGKRELSTSKRAAQNRAAQRAFRQRKEGYIKKLEEQVKDFQGIEQSHRALQNENFQLREYILTLQTRLLENRTDFPPAPPHVNLPSGPGQPPTTTPASTASEVEQQLRREMQKHGHDAMSHLQAAAAAASDARPDPQYDVGGEHPSKRARAKESADDDRASAS